MIHLRQKLWVVGRWLLWLTVTFVLLRGLGTFFPTSDPPAAAANPAPVHTLDPATDQTAGAFAALFVREYLTYTPEGGTGRAGRLQSFLAPSLDPAAGVNVRLAERAQTVLQAWSWAVEQLAPGRRLVTVVAEVQPASVEQEIPAAPRLVALSVPVAVTQTGLVVSAYPSFVPVPVMRPDADPGAGLPGEPVAEPDPQIRDLLAGFLKAYTSGTPTEIQYFLLPGLQVKGLGGQFIFSELGEYELRREGDRTWAAVQVFLEDPVTHAEFRQQLLLEIARQERWYVKAILQKGGGAQ